MNEAVEVTEKHMLGALCEDLGGANEQTCTRKLHFFTLVPPLSTLSTLFLCV